MGWERGVRALLAVLVSLHLLAACGGGDGDDGSRVAGGEDELQGRITVFAAASLTEVFGALGEAFEAANPGTEVEFSFSASSALVEQIRSGAPADVLATADEETMERLADELDGAGEVFATNSLTILVGRGNPSGIAALADLESPDVVLVVCAPEVPCGRLAQEVFDRAGIAPTPRSLEANVKAVASKVALGEADAGLVYVTDAITAGGGAERIEIPDGANVTTRYPIAKVAGAGALADAFIGFVRSGEGQQVLRDAGFASP